MQKCDFPENFQKIIDRVTPNDLFVRAITRASEVYDLKQHKIAELTPVLVVEMYGNVMGRVHVDKSVDLNTPWFENQRRIFLWLVFNYLFLQKIDLEEMTSEDWQFLQQIFPKRDPTLFRFQVKLLNQKSDRSCRHDRWGQSQNEILGEIVESMEEGFRWNDVAKQLFKKSNEIYFRTPKQCREQWNNHLDPQRSHGKWTELQDQIMLEEVAKQGKKWAAISKTLNRRRTEHMIKNRYNSLMKLWKKQFPKETEGQLLRKREQNLTNFHQQVGKERSFFSNSEKLNQLSSGSQVPILSSRRSTVAEMLPDLIVEQMVSQPVYRTEEMRMHEEICHLSTLKGEDLLQSFIADINCTVGLGSVL